MKPRQSGFTLIEVLVASLILFMAIALVSLAYRTGLNAERAAEKRVLKAVAMEFIKQTVVEELRIRPNASSGDGEWGEFSYNWKVNKRYEKWSKAGFDYETGSRQEFGRKLELLDVNIELEGEEYAFTYLSWQ